MPGKINPTQCEAITMVCTQVLGNDATISFAGASGNFELNVYRPVLAYNILQSIQLLADSTLSFSSNAIKGLKANKKRINYNLHNSLNSNNIGMPVVYISCHVAVRAEGMWISHLDIEQGSLTKSIPDKRHTGWISPPNPVIFFSFFFSKKPERKGYMVCTMTLPHV